MLEHVDGRQDPDWVIERTSVCNRQPRGSRRLSKSFDRTCLSMRKQRPDNRRAHNSRTWRISSSRLAKPCAFCGPSEQPRKPLDTFLCGASPKIGKQTPGSVACDQIGLKRFLSRAQWKSWCENDPIKGVLVE